MKILFFTFGLLLLSLGILGVALPGLPTTPFLLISTYCFARSSPRFHTWFTSTSFYKKYLATYVKTKGMTKKEKIYIL
ncbi:YbaN family protein [Anaerotignum sp. MB30-C6]|uniref:YbaN family protein n=1 Tax=Anaerotignum sp. MB30-C6 TaxID=3070814 RepID=UPI0027DBBC16|nr:YbaN family protein [Anaerotignum sp. MB30-C6]WMI80022.1 YbaN family protein [Anaerotignum sp. MB30-C6]